MTTKERFSPEHGFVPGVVIKVNAASMPDEFFVSTFVGVKDDLLVTRSCTLDKTEKTSLSEVGGITILSGPWSVWQLVPPDTVAILHNSPDILCFDKDTYEAMKDDLHKLKDSFIQLAPWWWTEWQKTQEVKT